MATDIMAMAKMAGISDDDLKGKSSRELIKIMFNRLDGELGEIEMESAKECVSNTDGPMSELKRKLEKPFEIYVKKVGQKKSPAVVPVVGYNASTGDTLVLFGGKIFSVGKDDMINSMEELAVLMEPGKGKAKRKKK